jgi:hypothetical protein
MPEVMEKPVAGLDRPPPELPALEGSITRGSPVPPTLALLRHQEERPAGMTQVRPVQEPTTPLLPEHLTRAPELPALPGQTPHGRTSLLTLADDYEQDLPAAEKPSLLEVVMVPPELPPLTADQRR